MIGIIGAMTIEVDELRRQLSGALDEYISGMTFSVGTLCGVPVVVAQSGVGKVAAAVCTQTMIQHFRVDAIINTGVAATLTDFLGIGDVAIADDVVQHDVDTTVFGSPPGHLSDLGEAYMPTDTVLTALVSDEAQKLGVRQAIGTIASGDQFLADKQRKDWIHKTFGAIAGEMEAGSIGQVCRLNRIPVAVIRVISDGAGGSPAEEYDAFVGQVAARSGQLVLATLKRLKASGSYLCGNGREFFGAVSWCREDIENALEVCEVTPSAAAVSAVTQFCKSSHFVERMVERGWDEMYGFINEHAKDWEEAEDNAN